MSGHDYGRWGVRKAVDSEFKIRPETGSDHTWWFWKGPGLLKKPRLSVVVPTYNRREQVALCVRALLGSKASPGDWELIVVDDGSTDRTFRYLNFEFGHYVNLRYVQRMKNVGKTNNAGLARNCGLRAARGNVVVFSDSDIVHLTDPVSATLNIMPGDYVYRLGGRWSGERRNAKGKLCVVARTGKILPMSAWFGARRETLMKIGGYDERFTEMGQEDADMWRRLRHLGLRVKSAGGMFATSPYARRMLTSRDLKHHRWQGNIALKGLPIVRNVGVDWGIP